MVAISTTASMRGFGIRTSVLATRTAATVFASLLGYNLQFILKSSILKKYVFLWLYGLSKIFNYVKIIYDENSRIIGVGRLV